MEPLRAAIGVGTEHKRATLDGVSVAYQDEGAGDPIVCLHALGHGSGDFSNLRDRTGARYRLVTLDWPGQGRSQVDSVATSARRYAELLGQFLDATGIEAPVLLGNSIGGAAAIAFASRHPERVRALVLANPGGLQPVNLLTRSVCRLMSTFFGAGVRGRRWFRPAFAAYYRMVLQQPPARDQRRRIVAAAYELAPILADAWHSFSLPESDLRPAIPGVTCPVLFTWARQDQISSFRRSRKAVRSFPNASVEFFRAGHAAFLEDPDAFAATLVEFRRWPAPVHARRAHDQGQRYCSGIQRMRA